MEKGEKETVAGGADNNEKKCEKLSTYDEYMKSLRAWKYNYDMYQWMNHMHQIAHYRSFMFASQQNLPPQGTTQNGTTSTTQPQPRMQLLQRTYKLPSFKRRVAAELVDAFVLITIKALTIWMLTSSAQVVYGDIFFQMFLGEEMESSIDNFTDEEVQLLVLSAFVYRFVSCFYEYSFIKTFGFTLGKRMFNMKVVQCLMVTGQDANDSTSFTVYPGGQVTNHSAWVRSVFKNVSIAFLIPSSVTALFNAHRRTSYDIFSRTMVVMTNEEDQMVDFF